jgi:hypothetical protein
MKRFEGARTPAVVQYWLHAVVSKNKKACDHHWGDTQGDGSFGG